MDLRFSAAEGYALPPDSYICVKIGEVLKQHRYDAKKPFSFPSVVQRRRASIDVFQRIGTCEVQVDPTTAHAMDIPLITTQGHGPMRMSLNVQPVTPVDSKGMMKSPHNIISAKAYMAEHDLEGMLQTVVSSMLNDRPEDPKEYICTFVKEGKAPLPPSLPPLDDALLHKLPPLPKLDPAQPAPCAQTYVAPNSAEDLLAEAQQSLAAVSEPVNPADVRNKARNSFDKGVNDGSLEAIMEKDAANEKAAKVAHVRNKARSSFEGQTTELERMMAEDARNTQMKLEAVRKKAAKGLASERHLHQTLERVAPKKPAKPDVQDVRKKARASLDRGVQSGKVESLLGPQEPAKPNPEDVRKKARNSFEGGVSTGKFEAMMAEDEAKEEAARAEAKKKKEEEIANVRNKARSSFEGGVNTGKLEEMMSEEMIAQNTAKSQAFSEQIKKFMADKKMWITDWEFDEFRKAIIMWMKFQDPNAEDVRNKAKNTFDRGVNSGKLEEIIDRDNANNDEDDDEVDIQPGRPSVCPGTHDMNFDYETSGGDRKSSVRLKAQHALKDGTESGSLEKIMAKESVEEPVRRASLKQDPNRPMAAYPG